MYTGKKMSKEDLAVHQSKVLAELIFENNVEKLIEIGVWKGTTTKKVLKKKLPSLKEYWAVDPWLRMGPDYGRMHTRTPQENWDGLYFKLCSFMYYFPQLRVLRLTSAEAAKIFPKHYFDLVFIDADHFYEPTLFDIQTWLPLVTQGGLLSGHDFGIRKAVNKAVCEMFGNDFDIHSGSVWTHKVN